VIVITDYIKKGKAGKTHFSISATFAAAPNTTGILYQVRAWLL
jgi:hypothetical protein